MVKNLTHVARCRERRVQRGFLSQRVEAKHDQKREADTVENIAALLTQTVRVGKIAWLAEPKQASMTKMRPCYLLGRYPNAIAK